jgi:hypothetical protein
MPAERIHVERTAADPVDTMLVNRISWGAVLAGVVITLSAHLILNMVGVGLGAAAIDPGSNDTPTLATATTTAGIWWSVVGIVSSFVGGLVAGRLSGSARRMTGALHGLTAWALTLLVLVYLFTATAQNVAGGAASALSGATAGVGQVVGGAVQGAAPALAEAADPFAAIEQAIRSGGNDPAALRDGAVAAVRDLLTADQAEAGAARERAADLLARAQQVPIDQARAQVGQFEAQYRETVAAAQAAATEAADATARAVSRTTLFASLALALGALAAWFGGLFGAAHASDRACACERLDRRRRGGLARFFAHLTTTAGDATRVARPVQGAAPCVALRNVARRSICARSSASIGASNVRAMLARS